MKTDLHHILEELKAREPIFHHPEKLGKTEQNIVDQLCDEFWEVGASGAIYTKQDVIETLIDRYNDPHYQDIWDASNFEITQIAPNNYLVTYLLVQNKTRHTRRATIWRKVCLPKFLLGSVYNRPTFLSSLLNHKHLLCSRLKLKVLA